MLAGRAFGNQQQMRLPEIALDRQLEFEARVARKFLPVYDARLPDIAEPPPVFARRLELTEDVRPQPQQFGPLPPLPIALVLHAFHQRRNGFALGSGFRRGAMRVGDAVLILEKRERQPDC